MVTFYAALVVCSLSAPQPGQPVLLDFAADWCGPCRSMEPVVHQLQAAGYPVRRVNIDQEKDLARRFNITSIPCFVMIAGGVEVGRIPRPASAAELQQLFAVAPNVAARQGNTVAGPGSSQAGPVDPFSRSQSAAVAPTMGPQTFASSANPPAFSAQAPVRQVSWPANNARPAVSDAALLAASVRIRVEDATGFSCGSGTIIDYQPGGEALVLTCGHLFRDSAGKGRIAVDTFGPTPSRQVPARLITYDMNRDLGLIAFRPQGTVTVAHVAPSGFQVQPGDAVASVGCNKGDDPTVRRSSITRINRFQGPANFSVAGQPVEGRSGGGLFTNDGLVIGVCNAADPGDQEGLFAALRSIQEELDERALTPVYRQRAEGSTMLASATVPLSTPAVIQSMPSTSAASPSFVQPASFAADASIPSNMPQVGKIASADAAKPGLSPGEQMALEEVRRRTHEGAEVVIIMRNRQDPQAKSEVFTVDRASPAFVEQLSAAGQSAPSQPSGPRETALEIPKARTPLLEWDREKGWQHRMDAPPN